VSRRSQTETPYIEEITASSSAAASKGGGDSGGVRLKLRIQPRSSKNAVEGVYGGSLKIRLTSPPVEGEANKALVKFLAGLLGVKKADITIESGHKSRNKSVVISGLGVDEAERILSNAGG
jgi:uncharacterized protein (TIGR00251 family)